MAFSDAAALAADYDFNLRTQACWATEHLSEARGAAPATWQAEHAWMLACQPGFSEAYGSAMVGGVARPGNDPAVISDGQILSAVQSIAASEAGA